MELSTTQEAISCVAPWEVLSILWNPKVQQCFHKSPPLIPVLGQTNPVHTTPSYIPRSILGFLTVFFHWFSNQ
jgi:hypothetical protein